MVVDLDPFDVAEGTACIRPTAPTAGTVFVVQVRVVPQVASRAAVRSRDRGVSRATPMYSP